jgi:tetratricopeptide (TPR) repeat protein
LYARQNDKALEQAKKTYDLDPDFRFGSSWLGQSYVNNGKHDEAIALAEKVLQASPTAQDILGVAGQAHAKLGHRREAEQYIYRLRELAKTQYVRSYYIANIYAALGDKGRAFAELENSIAEHDWYSPRMKVDPLLEPLRDDPRFKEMLKRMNLPE